VVAVAREDDPSTELTYLKGTKLDISWNAVSKQNSLNNKVSQLVNVFISQKYTCTVLVFTMFEALFRTFQLSFSQNIVSLFHANR
jgi:hypothetical protein